MGTKTKERPNPSDEDGEEEGGGVEVQSDVSEVEGGESEGEESEGEQPARIDLVGEIADDGHAADGSMPRGATTPGRR